jgi:hypothetical protein
MPLKIFWVGDDTTYSNVSRKPNFRRCGALTAMLIEIKVFWAVKAV